MRYRKLIFSSVPRTNYNFLVPSELVKIKKSSKVFQRIISLPVLTTFATEALDSTLSGFLSFNTCQCFHMSQLSGTFQFCLFSYRKCFYFNFCLLCGYFLDFILILLCFQVELKRLQSDYLLQLL